MWFIEVDFINSHIYNILGTVLMVVFNNLFCEMTSTCLLQKNYFYLKKHKLGHWAIKNCCLRRKQLPKYEYKIVFHKRNYITVKKVKYLDGNFYLFLTPFLFFLHSHLYFLLQERKHSSWYCRVQWLMGRASDSRLREPGFESCAAVLKPWPNFSLYIAPVQSAV